MLQHLYAAKADQVYGEDLICYDICVLQQWIGYMAKTSYAATTNQVYGKVLVCCDFCGVGGDIKRLRYVA